jgi:hypothetical protein
MGNVLDLAVVVPTYQERENVAEFIRRLDAAQDSLDIVIGTRDANGGSMGQFAARRVLLSRLQRVGRAVCRCDGGARRRAPLAGEPKG